MGIRNIHILSEQRTDKLAFKAQAALREKMIQEHRQGKHTYGSMRRECPWCRASK